MHLKDFADWYAENTDADYDDIIEKARTLVLNVYQDAYYEGLGRGYKQGEEDTKEKAGAGITMKQSRERMLKQLDGSFKRLA